MEQGCCGSLLVYDGALGNHQNDHSQKRGLGKVWDCGVLVGQSDFPDGIDMQLAQVRLACLSGHTTV